MVIDELEQALHGILTPGIQTGQRCHAKAAVTDPFCFEYLKGLVDDRFHHAAGGVFAVSRHIRHVAVFAKKRDKNDKSHHLPVGIACVEVPFIHGIVKADGSHGKLQKAALFL